MSSQHQQQKVLHHRRHRQSLKRQQGVVIVIALFVVALVATIAYTMITRLERDTSRTSLILRNTQAEFYAQGSLAWAIDVLKNNWEGQKPNQLIDVLPMKSPVNEVNGYKISSTIEDMQARFNLNNLSKPDAQADFVQLLKAVVPTITQEQAQEIARSTSEWIMPGGEQKDRYYLELPMPYKPSHRLMQSASELRLVRGITPGLFEALAPYIAALPMPTAINVQTATPQVLVIMSPTLNLETTNALVSLRKDHPFVSKEVFSALDIIKNHPIKDDKITFKSDYFLVVTTVAIENEKLVLYTLLERIVKGNKASLNILWQSKGTW